MLPGGGEDLWAAVGVTGAPVDVLWETCVGDEVEAFAAVTIVGAAWECEFEW